MDRAEATGLGLALAGHAVLLAILSLGLATATKKPLLSEPMEVSFVEEVGLKSAVTELSTEAPAPSVAPVAGPPEEAAPMPEPVPAPPEPLPPRPVEARPQPTLQPPPQPKVVLKPAPEKPAPQKPVMKPAPAKPVAVKAAPAKPAPQPARPAPAARPKPAAAESGSAQQTRGSRLGRDFLKGVGSDPTPSTSQKPSGAVLSPIALSGIKSAITRQIQPCADRQVNPGPGASEIVVTLNLRLNRDGSLAARPSFVRSRGVDDGNSRYEKRVIDLAIAAYTGCSPLRNLPEELYRTANGGWSNINMNYKLP